MPEMLLGVGALEPADAKRLMCYLAELVARRGTVHTAVAFNAIYFGYDVDFGGYVGGPIEFDRFPRVTFGEVTRALPVGAMVNVAAGGNSLYAEVIYKEGAHPELGDDGNVPAWLSGAPAYTAEPGQTSAPVLTERLVIDMDAFGQSLVVSQSQLDRLRRRGKWLDANGHLLLDARYDNADDAETGDTEFYARYLLAQGREQLLAGPLPLLLTEDAGEEQLAVALRTALRTVAEALESIDALRSWRDYSFTRAGLHERLTSHGVLGRDDLVALAGEMSHAGPSAHRRVITTADTVRYTAIGPRLWKINDAGQQLVAHAYPMTICHANTVIADYASREGEDGVLPGGSHLRLDDGWQGGGIWRASNPPGPYTAIDPRVPLGLGWLESQPRQVVIKQPVNAVDAGEHAEENVALPDNLDSGIRLLSVEDSHLFWTATLRLGHILAGTAALPERIVGDLQSAGLIGANMRLLLDHPTRDSTGLEQGEAAQDVDMMLAGHRARLTGVDWPLSFFPGILLTFSWQRGAKVLRAHSTLLEAPVTIEDVEYEHRYDPVVLTRDTAPGCAQRGEAARGPLSLRERVLRAVRHVGQLAPDGAAILRRDLLAYIVYGTGTGTADAALDPVIDELIADGTLSVEYTTIGEHRLDWPPNQQGELLPILVWRPRIVHGGPRQQPEPQPELGHYVEYWVAPHIRRLQPGQQASPEKRAEYRRLMARYGRDADLPRGYTLVDRHTRHR
ncbi:MAG: hypothetical protein ACRDNW_00260 [Trebonia sp.]